MEEEEETGKDEEGAFRKGGLQERGEKETGEEETCKREMGEEVGEGDNRGGGRRSRELDRRDGE